MRRGDVYFFQCGFKDEHEEEKMNEEKTDGNLNEEIEKRSNKNKQVNKNNSPTG